ncbi:MAG: hypothetical protein IKM66_06205 [Clostridia bacterium]|nr:hypothetical protein [Clostridia bacterium]
MKTKTFTKILIAVIILCLIFTIAHLIYTIFAYQNCSVIYFISKELW